MTARSYIRPLGLVYGPDAAALLKDGRAGRLAGHPGIAFTAAECIERRSGTRESVIVPYAQLAKSPELAMIERPRAAVAGLAMTSTRIMGIVNVTPDSFSDGGKFADAAVAIAHGRSMVDEGADILDIGGESTRPGSDPVNTAEEIARIVPVIAGLATVAVVSADTRKSEVIRAAADAGAKVINDVSALSFDSASAGEVARRNLPVVLMHAQGEPRTMQLNPRYEDVALDVYDALADSIVSAEAAGISRDNIVIDPGIGFGKTYSHNLELMQQLTLFHGLGVPVLVGLSRKGYVGALTGEKKASDRIAGSVGGALQAIMAGVHILRVHDVKATAQAAKVFTCGLMPDLAEF